MIKIKNLALTELFCFINDNIKMEIDSIDSENYTCNVYIKADYIKVNKLQNVTIISLGIIDLKTTLAKTYTVTIRTNSYKEIIILW